MKITKGILCSLLVLACAGIGANAHAHTMWINAVDYIIDAGRGEEGNPGATRTNVYFGFGHRYPVDDFMPQAMLSKFCLFDSRNRETQLEPNPGGFLATSVQLEKHGPYVVSAAVKPGYYTMHVEKGEIHHELGPKTGLRAVILSLYYEQYAKAILAYGDTSDDAFAKPLGDRIELVPLKNPYKLHGCGGHFLPVQVLFEGKPASFCKVYATYAGFSTADDFALVTMADSKGIAHIRLTHWGPWLIKANKRIPAEGEEKEKCNEMHYTATLTFEIQ